MSKTFRGGQSVAAAEQRARAGRRVIQPQELESAAKAELEQMCRDLGLSDKGKVAELKERIQAA
jgi:hypothetical protein